MNTPGNNQENEIKLRVESAAAGLARLEAAGFRISTPRVFESNTIYDNADLSLRGRRSLLRLRRAGEKNVLTFKGPGLPGRHKTREELETGIGDCGVAAEIFGRLGYGPVFRYEKYRTELEAPDGRGLATVDETPIGCFLELEGPPDWIDATAAALGFSVSDYVTASYAALYFEWCRERSTEPGNMVFG